MLSVRIPAELKAKLDQAARIRGNSTAKEMARLLEDQLLADVPIYLQFESLKIRMSIYQNQLACIEGLVLNATNPKVTRSSAGRLSELRKIILHMRADRSSAQRQREAGGGARAEERAAAATPVVNGPFKWLSNSGASNARQTQLKLSDRRWINLHNAIAGRARGTKKQLALELGWGSSQISQLLSSPNDRNHRTISTKIARKLEHALGLEMGALDSIEPRLGVTESQQTMLDFDAKVNKVLP